jgi:vancomycin resistance protein YoaR
LPAGVDRARGEAERLVGVEVVLAAASGDAKLAFGASDLGRALRSRLSANAAPRLDVFLDEGALRETIQGSRAALEKPARDATFDVSPLRQVTLVPSELGTRLDDDAIVRSIIELARGDARHGPLPFQNDVVPSLTTDQAEALHIDGLVSEYRTPFPCCEARVKSIERMAALVDKTFVRPGETWSLNATGAPGRERLRGGTDIVEGDGDDHRRRGQSVWRLSSTRCSTAARDHPTAAHLLVSSIYREGFDATSAPVTIVFRNDSEAGVFIQATTGGRSSHRALRQQRGRKVGATFRHASTSCGRRSSSSRIRICRGRDEGQISGRSAGP